MTGSARTDVAIIGAGAAGIAAARRLRALGFDCRVLEARQRVGGRAWTETDSLGVPLDRGCAWLHDADHNPLRPFAEAAGVGVPTEIPIRCHRGGAFASKQANAQTEEYVEAGLRQLAQQSRYSVDRATSDLLPDDSPQRPLLRYVLTAISGAEPEAYSSGDAAEEDAFESNWLVHGGLGRLVSADLALGVPIDLGTPVELLDYRRSPLRLCTPTGTLRARAVIVTTPPSALARGSPRFQPGLPQWKEAALDAVSMGRAEKVALRFRGQPFGNDSPHFLMIEREQCLIGFHIEPGPPALAIAYTGGNLADRIADMGETDAINMALEHLVHAYGARLRLHLEASTATAWARDPWVLGSYSAARPGGHNERAALAEPLGERVRFAGEATVRDAFATVHGAWLSGLREAEAVAAILAPASTDER